MNTYFFADKSGVWLPGWGLSLVTSLVSVTSLCPFLKFGGSRLTQLGSHLNMPVHSMFCVLGVQKEILEGRCGPFRELVVVHPSLAMLIPACGASGVPEWPTASIDAVLHPPQQSCSPVHAHSNAWSPIYMETLSQRNAAAPLSFKRIEGGAS